jgi:hypothetical protein
MEFSDSLVDFAAETGLEMDLSDSLLDFATDTLAETSKTHQRRNQISSC